MVVQAELFTMSPLRTWPEFNIAYHTVQGVHNNMQCGVTTRYRVFSVWSACQMLGGARLDIKTLSACHQLSMDQAINTNIFNRKSLQYHHHH